MKLSKKQREKLKEKFGGRCAYCGSPLGERWHADHIEPLERNDWLHKIGMDDRPPNHPDRHTIENLNPACPPCNIDKHSLSLENWRSAIERTNEVLNRDISTFRRAVRYGLVELSSKPVVFYFEKAALREALAEQPAQQEPVAWLSCNDKDGYGYWDTKAEAELNCSDDTEAEPLYTRPQAREWVGLTRAECLQIEKDMMKYYDYQHECKTVCLPEFARAIEAKLKEKNT